MATVSSTTSTTTRGFSETKDFRIASLGNVDSGKSTLVGCLTRGLLDDGKGKARSYVLRHQHEQKRGQSSSVTLTLMGYRDGKQVLPTSDNRAGKSQNKDFFEVATKATHRVSLVDLCGHQKYLKSSIYGLTAMNPDCAMVVVGAERGIQRMTREHVGLACALRIPFFIVLTKIDMAPPDVLKDSQLKLKRLLKRAGRKAYMVRNAEDVEGAVKCMESKQVSFAPVFEVSCVTGENLDNLREFVKTVSTSKAQLVKADGKENVANATSTSDDDDEECKSKDAAVIPLVTPIESTESSAPSAPAYTGPVNILLDDTYNVPGVGIVVGGTVRQGEAHVGQKLYVGPNRSGEYRPVMVRSIYRQCVPSRVAYDGQHATFAIKSLAKGVTLKRDMFRKGMVAVAECNFEDAKRRTVMEFEADIKVLHHSTTIDRGYSPFIHIAGSRQSARILQIRSSKGEDVVARTGSQVLVRFRFLHHPEYIDVGCPLIFREGNAKGCGRIVTLFDENGETVETINQ